MLVVSDKIRVPEHEMQITAIRAQGAGGQNVNKVSNAIHLRFNVRLSSLAPAHKQRLLNLNDRRISKDGTVVIKAQNYRSREKNLEEARNRLKELIRESSRTAKTRVPTRPSQSARKRRLDGKTRRGQLKKLRKDIPLE